MRPRVRFAPSPTGYLHVGGARTALFNWLYARRHGGTFVLRIEDTDVERSSADMVTGILDGLRWLGLDWDEGPEVGGPHAPYFQSERLERYRAAAARLVADGHAYYCYCSPERLQAERERAEARGQAWQYDRACLALTPERIAELEASGAPRAIRFKVPAGTTASTMRCTAASSSTPPTSKTSSSCGPTAIPRITSRSSSTTSTWRSPTSSAATITSRIRRSTCCCSEALGAPTPPFAHVPLILGADKKRLSKRHGATSVTEYQRQGYLPEAMVNFLALLGWSPGDDRELMSADELIERFSLEGISGGNAVFDTEKLDWMNGQYIARLPADELARAVEPFFAEAGLTLSS